MPVKRKQEPLLVNPRLNIVQEQMRTMGIIPGREMVVRSEHNRKQDALIERPVALRGHALDGTGFRQLVGVMQDLGIVTDELEDGGGFGVKEFPYAALINPQSPMVVGLTQAVCDVSSTSNTGVFSIAARLDPTIPDGVSWSGLVLGAVNLKHDANGNSRVAVEVEGTDYLQDPSGSHSGSWTRFEHGVSFTGVAGGGTFRTKILFRPSSAGTTTSAQARLFVYLWRDE